MNSDQLPFALNDAPFGARDPGNGKPIKFDRWNACIPLEIGSGAETNTLASPNSAGQKITLMAISVNGGSRTITVASPINAAGTTSIVFNAVDERVILESVGVGDNAYEWRIAYAEGVTVRFDGPVIFNTDTIYMADLPTADPTEVGRLYVESGALKVSAG